MNATLRVRATNFSTLECCRKISSFASIYRAVEAMAILRRVP